MLLAFEFLLEFKIVFLFVFDTLKNMGDTPNPTTGLTPREEEIIKNTWEVIKKDIPGNGYDLFIRYDSTVFCFA